MTMHNYAPVGLTEPGWGIMLQGLKFGSDASSVAANVTRNMPSNTLALQGITSALSEFAFGVGFTALLDVLATNLLHLRGISTVSPTDAG